jgi:hypothetical protein
MKQKISESYQSLLQSFTDIGYEVRSIHDFEASKPHLILRHDVDICLNRAYKLAQIEAEMGHSAIYYVLPSSPFYNVLSIENSDLIRKISELGHEIGLHLELEGDANLQKKADFEAGILREISQTPITSLSFHRPTANASKVKFTELEIEGYVSAYHKSLFTDIAYVSDSRGAWHYGHPLAHDAIKNRTAMQLLTHPLWWTKDAFCTPEEDLSALRAELDQRNVEMMLETFKV